jgi:DNA-binding winged helix-turn-helix (wHTH) protein
MPADRQFAFAAFRFDARTGQLWRGGSEVRLTPRAAAVLQCLIECAQEIVTKQDLFDHVWGGPAIEATVTRLTTLYRCTKSCPDP